MSATLFCAVISLYPVCRAEKERQEVETRRRIEARLKAKREAEINAKKELLRRRTPSPSRHTPTRILHVEGLTRPFTKDELRELLSADGPIMEEAFWIDKIRSHCVAVVSVRVWSGWTCACLACYTPHCSLV